PGGSAVSHDRLWALDGTFVVAAPDRHGPRGRDGIHGDQARQPPTSHPEPIIDREKPHFRPDWFDETRDGLVVLISGILFEVEGPRGADQRAHDGVRGLVDPGRAGPQPEA